MTRAECMELWRAARRGDDEKLQSLLGAGVRDDVWRNQVNWVHHRKGTTPLMEAARCKYGAECVRLLLAAGADENATAHTKESNAVLHYAAARNREATTVELLLAAGADPYKLNRRGHTPLDVARAAGRKEVVRVLTARMQVFSGWLYVRGSLWWKKRWAVLLACNPARTSTELCVFSGPDKTRPAAVLLLDETSRAFRFSSSDSYFWLKHSLAFSFDKPVMCQRVRRRRFTRAPICRKTMSFDDAHTRNLVFAADSETRLSTWLRVLVRPSREHSALGATLFQTADSELYYWPHDLVDSALRSSMSQQQQQQSQLQPEDEDDAGVDAGTVAGPSGADNAVAAMEAAPASGSSATTNHSSISNGSIDANGAPPPGSAAAIANALVRPQETVVTPPMLDLNGDEPPSQRRMLRARSTGSSIRPERNVSFAPLPLPPATPGELSQLDQLRQQYREQQQRRRQVLQELEEREAREAAGIVDDDGTETASTSTTITLQPTQSSSAIDSAINSTVANPQVQEDEEEDDEASRRRQERELCLICVNAPRDAVCTPCGHLSACHACLRTIIQTTRVCPICRSRIRSVMRIYDA